VIVAAGGFNGNIERVRQHWHRDWRIAAPGDPQRLAPPR
jgi:predicted oxidoreductase